MNEKKSIHELIEIENLRCKVNSPEVLFLTNRYQEALNELCKRCWLESDECECHPRYEGQPHCEMCEHKSILQELVDKETPMKVDLSTEREYDRTGEDWYYEKYYDCPKCENEIEQKINYCEKCGQKLDWGTKQ